MTKSIEISSEFPQRHSERTRQWTYIIIAAVANASLWVTAIVLLKFVPTTYSSKFAISLPSAASTTNVNLPNIGTASYENYSPFSVSTQDPRENYKLIASSDAVVGAAARALNLSREEFGTARIKLATNTSLLEFEVRGETAQQAQNKAWAMYKALQARLAQLRTQEVAQRDASFQSGLSSARVKLEVAQQRLSDYKASSGLSSSEQLKSFSDNIEQLRRQRVEILSQQQQASSKLAQLSANLQTSAPQATAAFVLKSDQVFQQLLKEYSDVSGQLTLLSAKYQSNHPQVRAEQAKQQAVQQAILTRGQALLGRKVSLTTLQQLNLNSSYNNSAQEQLLQEVVTVQAIQRGYQAQAQELARQIAQLDARLKVFAQQETTLDALKRDVQIAEAVFSSTLARLDIGRSTTSASYPLLQLLSEPNLPLKPSSPRPELVLLGTVLASLFITAGVAFLGRSQPQELSEKEL